MVRYLHPRENSILLVMMSFLYVCCTAEFASQILGSKTAQRRKEGMFLFCQFLAVKARHLVLCLKLLPKHPYHTSYIYMGGP